MPKPIARLIDARISDLEDRGGNFHPGPIPEMMQTGQIEDEDAIYWRAIASTVTDLDIADLERSLGVILSSQYRELLQHKHFIELHFGEAAFFSHPVGDWKKIITKSVFEGWPKEHLIQKGYLPFADFSDWGLLCFRVPEQNANGEHPVYRWDHERPESYEFFAADLQSALERLLSRS